jgi:transcriptional regulator with PAS, ATPase and Fis domain
MRMFAETESPVLILGPSGTGKELAARFIHDRSRRRAGPFIPINCAAFPEGLIEAELFGHVRGAFTGAVRDRKGRIASAAGGTLLLDEIGELALPAQAKLLRVLEEHRFCPVGSSTPVEVDVRVVSATNQDLRRAVAEGRFREDLYFRLRVLDISMPALIQRPGDLLLLVEHFLRSCALDGQAPRFSPRAWAALQAHAFPGNVRELKHVIERAVVLARGQDIRLEHLPDELLSGTGLVASDTSLPVVGLGTAIQQFERELIRHALHEAQGNRTTAARTLGISRKNLWQKLRAYRLTDEFRGDPDRSSDPDRS